MTGKPLTGLVVCGGNSSRMGQDKSLLQYHGEAQRYHVARLLKPFCDAVFLSLNETQTAERETEFPSLTDLPKYANAGPMAALLTAFHFLPGHNLIVVACDYPLFDQQELEHFTKTIQQQSGCRAFYNADAGFYEPLLAYYPADMSLQIRQQYESGNTSLQKILRLVDAGKHIPLSTQCIISVDDPEGYEQVKQDLAKRALPDGDNK
jgi:molybdopterin-guanine dinucleotide biosynthesis protein A